MKHESLEITEETDKRSLVLNLANHLACAMGFKFLMKKRLQNCKPCLPMNRCKFLPTPSSRSANRSLR